MAIAGAWLHNYFILFLLSNSTKKFVIGRNWKLVNTTNYYFQYCRFSDLNRPIWRQILSRLLLRSKEHSLWHRKCSNSVRGDKTERWQCDEIQHSGIFTTPKTGIYFFSFYGLGSIESYTFPQLYLNGNLIGSGWADNFRSGRPSNLRFNWMREIKFRWNRDQTELAVFMTTVIITPTLPIGFSKKIFLSKSSTL